MSKLEAVFPAPQLRREITRNNQWQNHARLAHHACFATESGVKFEKMKGNYSYYAISNQGYEWKGSYEVNGGGWKRVIIEIGKGKKDNLN